MGEINARWRWNKGNIKLRYKLVRLICRARIFNGRLITDDYSSRFGKRSNGEKMEDGRHNGLGWINRGKGCTVESLRGMMNGAHSKCITYKCSLNAFPPRWVTSTSLKTKSKYCNDLCFLVSHALVKTCIKCLNECRALLLIRDSCVDVYNLLSILRCVWTFSFITSERSSRQTESSSYFLYASWVIITDQLQD